MKFENVQKHFTFQWSYNLGQWTNKANKYTILHIFSVSHVINSVVHDI